MARVFYDSSIFAVVIGLVYLFAARVPLGIEKGAWIFLILAAFFAVIGNILMFKSIAIAPNTGFTLAIISANVLVVTIASIFLFKAEFTWIKAIGTLLAVAGIVLLGLK